MYNMSILNNLLIIIVHVKVIHNYIIIPGDFRFCPRILKRTNTNNRRKHTYRPGQTALITLFQLLELGCHHAFDAEQKNKYMLSFIHLDNYLF